MYRIEFEVIVDNPDDAYRLQDILRRQGMHVNRYMAEFMEPEIHHVHTMDGQTRAVRGVAEPPPRSVRRYYKDLSYDLIKSYERDKLLNDLLETDTKEDKDWREFLDEKDMEL